MMHNSYLALLNQMAFFAAILFPAFLLVFTFRGFARAWMAKKMGDATAYADGFMTLNPLAHVDMFGLTLFLGVILVLGALLGGGRAAHSLPYALLIFMGVRWTYPVPFQERNFKNIKTGTVMTLLSGSLGCFLLTFIFLYIFRYIPYNSLPLGVAKTVGSFCKEVIELASYFGVLALIPIPPFDGGRLLQFLLPYDKQETFAWIEQYSLIILLCLFVLPGISDLFFYILSIFRAFILGILLLFVF